VGALPTIEAASSPASRHGDLSGDTGLSPSLSGSSLKHTVWAVLSDAAV